LSQKIEAVLEAHGVEFRVSGANEILTRCPQCGASDPSQHLAISTRNRGWRCLRNPRMHRGRSYSKLLVGLLNCSVERARELIGEEAAVRLPDSEEFATGWRKQLGLTEPVDTRPKTLSLPKEFKRLTPDAPRSSLGFWNYLYKRGYTEKQADWAAEAYDLHYAMSGRYSYRLIVPVKAFDGQLMTWTARGISDQEIRYLTLKSDEARAAPGELLLGLPLLYKATLARCLVVCEGPFDAIAVSTLGHKYGVWGTCLFGLELSEKQADLLAEVETRFERIRVALDPEQAWLRMLDMRQLLPKRCKPLQIPQGFKDPGELIEAPEGADFIESLAA
jgi:hypothetical protein